MPDQKEQHKVPVTFAATQEAFAKLQSLKKQGIRPGFFINESIMEKEVTSVSLRGKGKASRN